ncbi:MAG: FCD domain-containing protein [Pseudomonadota bacterium]
MSAFQRLFEVSAELEGLAARLTSELLTDDAAASIQEGLEACVQAAEAGDASAYAAANLLFHGAIHTSSGNAWLNEQLAQIETRINPHRSMPYQVRGRLPQSVKEHEAIMLAMFEGRGEDAARLMRDQMMLQGKRLPLLLQNVA